MSNISGFTILGNDHLKKFNNFGQHYTAQPTPRQKGSRKQKLISKSHFHGNPGTKKKNALGTFRGNHIVNNLGNRMGQQRIGNQVLNSIMRGKSPS